MESVTLIEPFEVAAAYLNFDNQSDIKIRFESWDSFGDDVLTREQSASSAYYLTLRERDPSWWAAYTPSLRPPLIANVGGLHARLNRVGEIPERNILASSDDAKEVNFAQGLKALQSVDTSWWDMNVPNFQDTPHISRSGSKSPSTDDNNVDASTALKTKRSGRIRNTVPRKRSPYHKITFVKPLEPASPSGVFRAPPLNRVYVFLKFEWNGILGTAFGRDNLREIYLTSNRSNDNSRLGVAVRAEKRYTCHDEADDILEEVEYFFSEESTLHPASWVLRGSTLTALPAPADTTPSTALTSPEVRSFFPFPPGSFQIDRGIEAGLQEWWEGPLCTERRHHSVERTDANPDQHWNAHFVQRKPGSTSAQPKRRTRVIEHFCGRACWGPLGPLCNTIARTFDSTQRRIQLPAAWQGNVWCGGHGCSLCGTA